LQGCAGMRNLRSPPLIGARAEHGLTQLFLRRKRSRYNRISVGMNWFSKTAAVALLAACAGCSYIGDRRFAAKPEKDRKTAPDFALKDVAGKTVKLSDYRGQVVLLNFWATWCEPCQLEIPWFMDFQQSYKDRKFAIVGISVDDDGWDSVKPYLERRKINYPVVVGNEQTELLFGGIDAIPTTFLLDRAGRIAYVHQGLISKSEYENEILELLRGKEPYKVGGVSPSGSPALLRLPELWTR
jgi:peroxiredoxin